MSRSLVGIRGPRGFVEWIIFLFLFPIACVLLIVFIPLYLIWQVCAIPFHNQKSRQQAVDLHRQHQEEHKWEMAAYISTHPIDLYEEDDDRPMQISAQESKPHTQQKITASNQSSECDEKRADSLLHTFPSRVGGVDEEQKSSPSNDVWLEVGADQSAKLAEVVIHLPAKDATRAQ